MRHEMLLVCHAADGYFADGNRLAVCRLLDRAGFARHTDLYRSTDDSVQIFAPGLDGSRSFHRMGLYIEHTALTLSMLSLIFDLMLLGDFGLMPSLDACSFVVTSGQQAYSYPWLPEPPQVVHSAVELAHLLDEPALLVCA